MRKSNNNITAYCWRNGQIGFGRNTPEGAIAIVTGPRKRVRDLVLVRSRKSYPSKPGAGDEVPLVPGIPEADNTEQALNALSNFATWIKQSLEAK